MTYQGMSAGLKPSPHEWKVGVQKFILRDCSLVTKLTASEVSYYRWRTSLPSMEKLMYSGVHSN